MDLIQALPSVWSKVVDRFLDEIEISILRAYIRYRSISVYRASNLTGIAVSTGYRKARRLLRLGLIRRDGSHTFRVTVRGLLQCLAQGCENTAFLVNKIRLAWRLNASFEEICSYLIALAQIMKRLGLTLGSLPHIERFEDTVEHVMLPALALFQHRGRDIDLVSALTEYYGVDNAVASLSKRLLISHVRKCVLDRLKSMILLEGLSNILVLLNDGTNLILIDPCKEDHEQSKLNGVVGEIVSLAKRLC